MTVGLVTAAFANKVLDHMLRAAASTAPAANYVKLHTADPGAAATTAPSANTTRVVVTYAAAASGSCALNGTPPSWATWAAGAETLSHISVWDASTAGTYLFSAALTTPKAITNGDTFTLSSLTVSLAPLAA